MSNNPSEREKTLEMRIAALEDKLSQSSVTEEEVKAYHKVAALIASRGGGATAAGAAQGTSPCVASNMSPIYDCIWNCHIYPHILPRPHILDCIQFQASGVTSGSAGTQFGALGKQQGS